MNNLPMALEPGVFYMIDGRYILPFHNISIGSSLDPEPVEVECVFTIQKMRFQGNLVALAFDSPYKIHNDGGYIWTKSPKAQEFGEYKTIIRDSRVVIYNFDGPSPSTGMALAISPRIGPYVEAFFQEQ